MAKRRIATRVTLTDAQRERPTGECESAVEAVMASPEAADEGAARSALLRLLPSHDVERRAQAPDQELDRGGLDAGGQDAA